MEAARLTTFESKGTAAAAPRRPLERDRNGGRPVARRRRPRADVPTPPRIVRGTEAARPASSPRRADSDCRCRDRAVELQAPRARPTSRTLDPRLAVPRRDARVHRGAPRRGHDLSSRPPRPRSAARSPRRGSCVLTALPHGASRRPPCECGAPCISAATPTHLIALRIPWSAHAPAAGEIRRHGGGRGLHGYALALWWCSTSLGGIRLSSSARKRASSLLLVRSVSEWSSHHLFAPVARDLLRGGPKRWTLRSRDQGAGDRPTLAMNGSRRRLATTREEEVVKLVAASDSGGP